MALNFPNSPSDGQIYIDGSSGNRWVWDTANTCWKSTSTFTQTITVAATAPGSPVVGQLWWSQDYGRLLVYYSDGTSSQWVDASPSDYTSTLAWNTANSALQNTNVTLAGNLTSTGSMTLNKYPFYESAANINFDYTINTGMNAFTPGPVAIANGIFVTIPDGSYWSVT